ncbi:MAG: ion transporter [Anaerotardibacter sp.]
MGRKNHFMRAALKESAFRILDNCTECKGIERVISIILFAVIILNVFLILVVYDASISTNDSLLVFIVDSVSSIIFLIEYLGRLWTADKFYPHLGPVKSRLRYAFSAMGIIDLFSFAPYFLYGLGLIPSSVTSSLRILKVLRLLKISRYMMGWHVIVSVFKNNIREITAAFAILLLFSLTASALMCQFEQPVQPDVYNNIFTGLYWAIQTITSTGYGDVTPITPPGRALGFCAMVLSIGIVAVPAGIFSAGFIEEFEKRNKKEAEIDYNTFYISGTDNKIFIEEEAPASYPDYTYCPHCGKPLPHYVEKDPQGRHTVIHFEEITEDTEKN